jgi:hypothetical protein
MCVCCIVEYALEFQLRKSEDYGSMLSAALGVGYIALGAIVCSFWVAVLSPARGAGHRERVCLLNFWKNESLEDI